MSSISVAEWDSIYNKSLELISKVKAALDPHAGTKDFGKVQTSLNVIENHISKMQNGLNSWSGDSSKAKLSDRDIKRRQNMIDGIKREKAACDAKLAKCGGNVGAKNLLFDSLVDPESLRNRTDEEIHTMQQQTFANQEQALEDISDTLGRLHEIGTAIGSEVDIQTKLLGEIDHNVGYANDRMVQESKRAKQVAKKSGMCKWYCVILLLLFILIYLIIIYIKK